LNGAAWTALAERFEAASAGSRALDAAMAVALGWRRRLLWRAPEAWGGGTSFAPPRFSADLSTAVSVVDRTLPGWWWSCGSCHLTGDGDVGALNPRRLFPRATVGPDRSDPRAEGLPEPNARTEYDEGFSTSLDGGGAGFAVLAFCASYCRARAALSGGPEG
jgi:hypothetical protein